LTKRLRSITRSKGPAILAILILLVVWEIVSDSGLVPKYMLPSPVDVVRAFISDFSMLWSNLMITLQEAIYGLALGVAIGFGFAVLMDSFEWLRRAVYPLLVITQTVPTVAIAPLLVLWFGYEMTPKIILIIIVTFFPVTVGMLDGFRAVDPDSINLLRSMGAGKWQIFRYIKCPAAMPQFFSGLRIAAAYSVVGAVIAEWLGGFGGLGVYMTRVKKAFAFDKMFAVIFLISAISLALMGLVNLLQKKAMPYAKPDSKN
jgi:ABC-type nitrate/sulfonate/bicarbonate transport system permease component